MDVKVFKYSGQSQEFSLEGKTLVEVIYENGFEIHNKDTDLDVLLVRTEGVPFNNSVDVILPTGNYILQPIVD
jgi:hypothetical protein